MSRIPRTSAEFDQATKPETYAGAHLQGFGEAAALVRAVARTLPEGNPIQIIAGTLADYQGSLERTLGALLEARDPSVIYGRGD
jgi:hypothetical protein